jgi:hypothetical protein
MWSDLPIDQKEEYKRMILSFASLTEAFAQKAEEDDDAIPSPIINSKYQETVFQRSFHATPEDIGNTSYDASVIYTNPTGQIQRCMVGIKTFGIGSGQQKIAQFKANRNAWSELIELLRRNAIGRTREEINEINEEIYLDLATRIATLRNMRIDSSEANLRGFIVSEDDDSIRAVYHVLMPSRKNEPPTIFVGETDYNRIEIDNINVLGCTGSSNPTNFDFTDGRHRYRFTAADSQLLMDFNNNNIVQERWPVIYVDDAYAVFEGLADQLFGERHIEETDDVENIPAIAPEPITPPVESYSWKITNSSGEVELFSGFNGFYGTGSKLATNARENKICHLHDMYEDAIESESLTLILNSVHLFLTERAGTMDLKLQKVALRENIIEQLNELNNEEFTEDIMNLLFRPVGEMYIPIPNSAVFHTAHPDFFAPGVGNLVRTDGKWKLPLPKEQNQFTLVFDPSGDEIEAFITQDAGKGIESCNRQSILGEWILHGLFRLAPYEPLTRRRLDELGINGIRLTKAIDSKIHISFIWIDNENLPVDYRE